MAQGLRVLDVGCGKGYGTAILSKTASEVLGLDLNPQSLAEARKHFETPKTQFESQDVTRPAPSLGKFDLITAFEVIEHLPPSLTDDFLLGLGRLLTPQGRLLLSTPNHDIVTLSGVHIPAFHINNFEASRLRRVLSNHFEDVELLGQFKLRPLLEQALFNIDFLNLRHRLKRRDHRPSPKQTPTRKNNPKPTISAFLTHPPTFVARYRFSPWRWRQAGLTVAACKNPRLS